MCSNQRFFICKHCGNLAELIIDKGTPLVCCGEKMTELVANTVDASKEKHVPVVKVNGNIITATVGSVIHPMEEKHHIAFIYLETKNGSQRKCLKVGDEPIAEFTLINDEAVAVYEYCNLHGLWKTVL
ncbi:MAG TPA: desulfoferrodoxin family protein [Bacillota bacterium]|nr:desulfoferrodoxin family protein [Bacillota bacterium]HOR85577.1 desulfoferrodoxin family protein [Bacillota bacterium]HPL53816.1 desulfoferrodoxin family protein [Bacillota bacterium]